MFETKFREPNPKLLFYIAMAVLGVFALGTVVYFWYQLRPPPPMVNTSAKPPRDEKKIEVVPPQSTVAPSAGQAPAPLVSGLPAQPVPAVVVAAAVVAAAPGNAARPPAAAPGVSAAPQQAGRAPAGTSAPSTAGTSASSTAGTSASSTAGTSASSTAGTSASSTAAPRQRAAARETRPQADASKLSVHRAAPEVNPKLEVAWLAYNQGNLAVARSHYQDVLRDEPTNRDALLGMAAVEVRASRSEYAEIYYQKLLESNPRDPHAQAGLFALRAHMTDPVQAESRVKSLLANDPEAYVLYFTLGNQYAQQGRWPEAQQAYFKAFSADPGNPDFAYNLGVSLDHVRQPKLALEYYRRAISLAQQRSSNFDQALARNRAQELAR